MGPLDAKALARIEPHLDAAAQATVDDLVGRQSFDGNGPLTNRRVLGASPHRDDPLALHRAAQSGTFALPGHALEVADDQPDVSRYQFRLRRECGVASTRFPGAAPARVRWTDVGWS